MWFTIFRERATNITYCILKRKYESRVKPMRRPRHIWAAAECSSLIGRDATPPVSQPGAASTNRRQWLCYALMCLKSVNRYLSKLWQSDENFKLYSKVNKGEYLLITKMKNNKPAYLKSGHCAFSRGLLKVFGCSGCKLTCRCPQHILLSQKQSGERARCFKGWEEEKWAGLRLSQYGFN